MTVANNSTLRLAVGNSLDSVFVWNLPLGGKRAYSDGTCPSTLERTLTGEAGSQYGTAVALSENGKTLVIGAPGSASKPDASVIMVDIELPKAPPPPASSRGLGALFAPLRAPAQSGKPAPRPAGPSASSLDGGGPSAASLDNTYFVENPSSVLVSPRRGGVGVPAPQPFDLNSWAMGSPGGAPYNPALGYSISPDNPYMSGGRAVKPSSTLGLLSAMSGLGLSTASLRSPSLGAGKK